MDLLKFIISIDLTKLAQLPPISAMPGIFSGGIAPGDSAHCLPGENMIYCRVCQAAGDWGGSSPSCSIISCGHPPALEHGEWQLHNMSTGWHDLAQYSCTQHYSLVGKGNQASQWLLNITRSFPIREQIFPSFFLFG